jgi:mannitol-specific phosphotransferase system IIBC component
MTSAVARALVTKAMLPLGACLVEPLDKLFRRFAASKNGAHLMAGAEQQAHFGH